MNTPCHRPDDPASHQGAVGPSLLLGLSLLALSGCYQVGNNHHDDTMPVLVGYDNALPTVSSPIDYEITAGSVAPWFYYVERATITEGSLTLVRTGGANVIAGFWSISLFPDEIRSLNVLLDAISASDADLITYQYPAVGGGSGHIFVGEHLQFYSGPLTVDGVQSHHAYSPDVRALQDQIASIIATHDLQTRHKSNG